jgi:hypothetical protein
MAFGVIDMNITIEQIESSHPVRKSNGYSDVKAYWVPMRFYDDVRETYKDAGIKIRIRFRGSRIKSIGREMPRLDGTTYRRTRNQANQDCLMADATHFTVYGRK